MTWPKTAMTLPSFRIGIALDDHILSTDALALIDFGYSGLGHNVHACIFDNIRAVLSYLFFGIYP
jgi:hypothetical protein